jgi:peptidoglycan/LPS O-acetylase OafA/YrhL
MHSAQLLEAYPFATTSSLAAYCFLVLLSIPATRRVVSPYFVRPTPPHQQFLGSLDTFRGLAASLVALGHCWWATYPMFAATQWRLGFIAYNSKAVPIFAVLSGFLIYRSVLTIKTIEGLRNYAIRRFFRIYPVYAAGVLLAALTSQYLATNDYHGLGRFFADLFMLQTIEWPGSFGNPPTWSLYVEVVFYAYLPLVVITLGRSRMLWFSAALFVVLLIADSQSRVLGLWKFFSIGIMAAELFPYTKRFAVAFFSIGVLLLIWDFGGPPHDWFAGLHMTKLHEDGETIGLGIASAMILISAPHLKNVGVALNMLPLRILGVISYSVYIMHFFYLKVVFEQITLFSNLGSPEMKAVWEALPSYPWWYLPFVIFPGVLFWGLISFLLIERPGIRFGQWLTTRHQNRAQASAHGRMPISKPIDPLSHQLLD